MIYDIIPTRAKAKFVFVFKIPGYLVFGTFPSRCSWDSSMLSEMLAAHTDTLPRNCLHSSEAQPRDLGLGLGLLLGRGLPLPLPIPSPLPVAFWLFACCLASVLFDVGLVKSQRSQRAGRIPCTMFHVQPCLLMNSWTVERWTLAAYFALSYFHFQ